jgi:nitroreductase
MEAIDLLLTRRSVAPAQMMDPGPSDADLEKIMSAAIRVPDHGKITPWRVQVIKKPAQKKLGDLYAEIFKKNNPNAEEKQVEYERLKPQKAPLLLCVTAKLNPEHKIPLVEQRLSGGAFCLNLLNATHALGFGANWVTGWPAYNADIKKALGHSPDTDIIGFIYLGSVKEVPMDRPRPPVTDVVSEWKGVAAEVG